MNDNIIIRHGYKYRLRTQPRHEILLRQYAGSCRYVWNKALALQQARHAAGEQYANYIAMAKWLTQWRNDQAFLKAVPVHALQATLKDLDQAFQRFFKSAGGYPRFKSRHDAMSLSEPDVACFKVDEARSQIRLPKLGWVRYRNSQPIAGSLRNLTVSHNALGWHVSIQTEIETPKPIPVATSIAAGDRGISQFITLSNGTFVAPLNAHQRMMQRLTRYQRNCARKVEAQKRAAGIIGATPKGMHLLVSQRLKRARKRVASLQAKIARSRSDFLHKLSTDLANQHAVFVLEDLRVKNMTASSKGDAAAPGRNVRQKAGLNRSILDQGWAMFETQLEYKMHERGAEVIYVPPHYTSQRCHACGYTDVLNRNKARFACLACGHCNHADTNAAKNILAAGHAVLAGRSALSATFCYADVEDMVQSDQPVKRQPTKDVRCAG